MSPRIRRVLVAAAALAVGSMSFVVQAIPQQGRGNTPPPPTPTLGLENGTLNPVIGKEFPLAEAAKAHVAIMESAAYGKIVLVP